MKDWSFGIGCCVPMGTDATEHLEGYTMKITARHVGTTTASVLLALSLAGCGKLAEEALEQAVENESGEDVEIDFDADDGSFSIEGENGEEFSLDIDEDGEASVMSGTDEDGNTFEMSTGQEIPDEWPGDVPTPPGSVLTATVISENGERMLSVAAEVPDAERAHEGYVEQLKSIGFTVESTSSFDSDGTTSSFAVLGRDDWTAQVNSSSNGDDQTLIVALQSTGS